MTYELPIHDTDILIVGAGPTGLVLALWLARRAVRVKIIDKTAGPSTTSRAMAVQARTLEFYRQLGIAGRVVERGRWASAVNLWESGRRAAHIDFSAGNEGISPYPYPLIFPQDEHERFLIERLTECGVTVERTTELVTFESTGSGILARLRRAEGREETCTAAYIAGCDGARSKVRGTLGIGFPGGTYEHIFYVADVEARGPAINGELNVSFSGADFVAIFPMKGECAVRLIGTVRDEELQARTELSWDDVSKQAIEQLGVDVSQVNWFSTYRVHHRVADCFRKDRAFLLGDAAHVHSPVGGQGMNTGIGDAVNLAWKLAAVVGGKADESLLDTYEPERIAFARKLVATTDRAFTLVTSKGGTARFVRLHIVARMAPLLFGFAAMRRYLFRVVSQTLVNYRRSSLSVGRVGAVGGGDRLPWVRTRDGKDNFAELTSLDWQIHVYGAALPALRKLCNERAIPLHEFQWESSMAVSGLRRNAVYLVRPDGYLAVAQADGSAGVAALYLDRRGLTF